MGTVGLVQRKLTQKIRISVSESGRDYLKFDYVDDAKRDY